MVARGLCKPWPQTFIIEEPSDDLLDLLWGQTVVSVSKFQNGKAEMVHVMQDGKLLENATHE